MEAAVNEPKHCACCGRQRGDGRRDRGWLYWVVDVLQRRGDVVVGPLGVRVAFCATCWRVNFKPRLDELYAAQTATKAGQ